MLSLQLAEGSYLWPALAALGIIATILVRLTGFSADVIFLGFLLVGYIVGNRGFAQLMPYPSLPLLPAEAGLLVAVTWRTIICTFERDLPFRRDALNWVLLAWLIVGGTRLLFDLPRFKILALRDFALVYYAAFFFIVQHMARSAAVRRYLVGCLVFSFILLGPLFGLFIYFERHFVTYLSFFGAPLIYYKSDLVATHLGAGSFVLFFWAAGRHRFWAWPLSCALFLFVLSWDSRASMLGAVVAAGILLLARRWQFPGLQAAIVGTAFGVVVLMSVVFDNTWANRKVEGLQDRLRSIVDYTGSGRYESDESAFKGDNNRFRLVWWRRVVEETNDLNPVFGQGFGADLARGFVQEYYPDSLEDFSARSPHNVFLAAFGRMGGVGLAVFLAFVAVLFRNTWRSLRGEDRTNWSLWCSAWIILVSASFGVVLEGPMGAVVFWSLLGLANAPLVEEKKEVEPAAPDETEPADAMTPASRAS
jgi:hypothetical protein